MVDPELRRRRERLARNHLAYSHGVTLAEGCASRPPVPESFDDTIDPNDFTRAFPALRFELAEIRHRGDQLCLAGTVIGDQWGTFRGIAPTGRTIEIAARWTLLFDDDRVVSRTVAVDTGSLMAQVTHPTRADRTGHTTPAA